MFNKQIHKRIKILLLLIILAFIIIISKIFYIQVIEYKKLSNLANNLWSRNLIIGANRGRILTNDNVTIASNLTTVSLVVVPNQIKNKDDIIKDLAKILKPMQLNRVMVPTMMYLASPKLGLPKPPPKELAPTAKRLKPMEVTTVAETMGGMSLRQ